MIPILHNETTSVKKEKKKKRVRRYINKRELRLPVHSIESLSRESLGGTHGERDYLQARVRY